MNDNPYDIDKDSIAYQYYLDHQYLYPYGYIPTDRETIFNSLSNDEKLKFKYIKNYTLDTLLHSDVAKENNIDNKPKDNNIIFNLYDFCYNILDPLTDLWNAYCSSKGIKGGIEITSGYRCPKLNTAVKGANDSAHKYGLAADMRPCNWHNKTFLTFCYAFLKKMKVPVNFDQLINEKPLKNGSPSWIHLGYKAPDGRQRNEYFTIY